MIQNILAGQGLNPNQFGEQQQFAGQQQFMPQQAMMPMQQPMQLDPYGQSVGNLRQILMGGRYNG